MQIYRKIYEKIEREDGEIHATYPSTKYLAPFRARLKSDDYPPTCISPPVGSDLECRVSRAASEACRLEAMKSRAPGQDLCVTLISAGSIPGKRDIELQSETRTWAVFWMYLGSIFSLSVRGLGEGMAGDP